MSKISCDLGRLDEAIRWLERAQKIDETNVDVITSMADIYTRKKENDTAIKLYTKQLEDKNHDQRSLVGLGNTYYSSYCAKGGNKIFNKIYENAFKYDKQNVFAANGMGLAFAEMKSFDTARELFIKVIFVYNNYNLISKYSSFIFHVLF